MVFTKKFIFSVFWHIHLGIGDHPSPLQGKIPKKFSSCQFFSKNLTTETLNSITFRRSNWSDIISPPFVKHVLAPQHDFGMPKITWSNYKSGRLCCLFVIHLLVCLFDLLEVGYLPVVKTPPICSNLLGFHPIAQHSKPNRVQNLQSQLFKSMIEIT